MKLYNPTGYEIETQANGKVYNFEPFQEKDVHIDDHAIHIVKSFSYLGIVHLYFSKEFEKKYDGDFKMFKQAQRLRGLNELKKWMNQCYINERQAITDIKQNKGAVAEKELVNPDRFKEKLNLIDQWIVDVDKANAEEKIQSQPELNDNLKVALKRKPGRPRKYHESRRDENESAA